MLKKKKKILLNNILIFFIYFNKKIKENKIKNKMKNNFIFEQNNDQIYQKNDGFINFEQY